MVSLLKSVISKNATLFVTDGCVSEPTIFSDSLIWSETDLGQTVSISCPCGDLSLGVGHPSAQRQCTGSFTSGAQWSTANDSSCNFTNSTQQLCKALEVSALISQSVCIS